MKKSMHSYALDLAEAFRIGETLVSADEFESDFSFAFEQALSFFKDYGYITDFELNDLLAFCERGTQLESVLQLSDGKEKIENLICRVSTLKSE